MSKIKTTLFVRVEISYVGGKLLHLYNTRNQQEHTITNGIVMVAK